jgi:hypothetical protein
MHFEADWFESMPAAVLEAERVGILALSREQAVVSSELAAGLANSDVRVRALTARTVADLSRQVRSSALEAMAVGALHDEVVNVQVEAVRALLYIGQRSGAEHQRVRAQFETALPGAGWRVRQAIAEGYRDLVTEGTPMLDDLYATLSTDRSWLVRHALSQGQGLRLTG